MSTVNVEKNTYTVEPMYQWDLNQTLVIYGLSLASVPEVHFTTTAMGKAIVRQATMDAAGVIRAEVPNSLLQKPYTIQAYICIYEGSTFETQYKLDIPVKARNKPEDYTLEDDHEVYSFNALENQVVNALAKVAEAETDYKAAEAMVADAKTAYESAAAEVEAAVADAVDTAMAEVNTAVEEAVDAALAERDDSYIPRMVSITLTAAGWVEGESIYTQAVTVGGGTADDLVALQPTDAQMLALIEDGVAFLKVDNDGGTFTAKAGGAAPTTDMTIQAALTEVSV